MGVGPAKGLALVQSMTGQRRSRLASLGLTLLLCSSAVFLGATEGFYGTTFQTVAEALARPLTGPLSDDVYPCSQLNSLGDDDDVAVVSLWLLLPMLAWRHWNYRAPPTWAEATIFTLLSLPAILMLTSATCANIALTFAVGNASALTGCALGWTLAAAAYFWPLRPR